MRAEGRIDEYGVDRAVTLVESTSPNSLLLGSLDAARHFAANEGPALLAETIQALRSARQAIRELPGLDVLDERMIGRPGVFGYDPLRLAVDVRATGATGYQVAQLMHQHDDVNLELAGETVIVAVFGMGETATDNAARLVEALGRAVEHLGFDEDFVPGQFTPPPPWGALEMTPREAFLGPQEVVPVGRGGRAHRGRVAGLVPARHPQRAARRAHHGRHVELHRGDPRARRQPEGRERPQPAHRARGGGVPMTPRYGPPDAVHAPRYTGVRTFARCPLVAGPEDVDVAAVGIPFDTATSNRPGARFGPEAIRACSIALRPYHPALDVDVFAALSVADLGDLDVTPGNAERTAGQIAEALGPVVEAGALPLVLGGDHSVVLG